MFGIQTLIIIFVNLNVVNNNIYHKNQKTFTSIFGTSNVIKKNQK